MSDFNPADYQIVIQKRTIEGETFFVGSVMEIPHLNVYENSGAEAYTAICGLLTDLYDAAQEDGRGFPAPAQLPEMSASGRVTLRVPKTLHATLERQARNEGMSLNQHMVYLLADATARIEQGSHIRPIVSTQSEKRVEVGHILNELHSNLVKGVKVIGTGVLEQARTQVVKQFRYGISVGAEAVEGSMYTSPHEYQETEVSDVFCIQ